MVRFVVRTLVGLAANAIGLIVAATVVDGMDLDASSFIIAVVIFTIVFALMQPFLASQLRRRGSSALGGVALIATLISLIITDLVSDGFSIDGLLDWLLAAVIVWAVALLAVFILPYLGLRKYMEESRA